MFHTRRCDKGVKKHATRNGPAVDKVKLKERKEENRQLRRQLRLDWSGKS
jgi:hypothetical protein